jgi:hypothetical protein
MRTSFHHQSEAQPPNGPLTAVTSPDTPSAAPASQSGQPIRLHRLNRAAFSGTRRWIPFGSTAILVAVGAVIAP